MATHSPPVDSLPYDLLLDIFEMNADMFSDPRALNTARFTSQVCRSWRNIMLATPSIWAKLIDIDCTSRVPHIVWKEARTRVPHNIWREELIRRGGTSLLWIKADLFSYSFRHVVNFFFDLIREHWGRIQKLVAKVYCRDVDPTLYAPLLLPAPHLETFEFDYGTGIRPDVFMPPQESPYLTVFSGQAPMLRRLDFERHRPDSSAPWLHQLHFINLTWGYTTLSVLSATHNLRELKIFWPEDEHMVLSLFPVALPNLKRLGIFGLELPEVTSILDHLKIPRGCSLDIYADSDMAEDYNFWPVVNTLSSVAQRYFQSHPPNKLFFEYSEDKVILKDSTRPGEFSLAICFFEPEPSPIPTRHFLAKLTLAEFSGVKELALYIEDVEPISFLSFTSCFPLVQTIHTSEQDLRYLTNIQGLDNPESARGGCQNVFPHLTTVILVTAHRQKPWHRIGKVTTDFVLSRIEHGHPLSVLDLTQALCVEPTALDLLRDIAGLEILTKADDVGLVSV
ncbi:hypothetical protein HYPSUDRAFT_39428 [Hypholoma sublateritium FD-334 SS-4]|uniref:F-box domain-containing protein n=1 Tax=Hypholoma sublateritium (strain FD-334 SS-4) TaxID=945553 RepID=A0A0D2L9K2_HYPSF|nr:hypothetical protein HYPSUDRAFT_39428 [Hypholoma sublateritium FD-334 SS-4]